MSSRPRHPSAAAIALALVAACGERLDATPAAPPAATIATPVATPLADATPPPDAAPGDAATPVAMPPADAAPPAVDAPPAVSPPAADPAVATADAPPLIGWWRGQQVCLELFANGDFELSLPGRDPKVMVLGGATLTPRGADRHELRLVVTRIWRARFTSPCRKVHEYGGWIDAEQLLGRGFKPGEATTLTLRRAGDQQLELCGEGCETLTRATPALTGRWRRAALEVPDRPGKPWRAGDLLELDLGAHGHVWAGMAAGKWGTAYGAAAARFVAADRFAVEFTPDSYADLPAGVVPQVLGLSLELGATRGFTARRLAGERLEVCAANGRCGTLERQFSGDHHDLD